MPSSKRLDQKELLELGTKLQQFYNSGYVNKKQSILFAFYKGVASGFGALIGGTIVVGVLIWILSLFHQLPFAHNFINALHRSSPNN